MNLKNLSTIILFLCITLPSTAQNTWQYYFDNPASIWEESIPLGNGRIGMMPWGDVNKEKIVLNEISLWSGNKQDVDNPEAYKYLGEIRKLLFENKNKEAQDLMYKTFTCLGKGSADTSAYGSFQTLGNIQIDFSYPNQSDKVTNYRRILDINNALSTTSYKKGNITYTREYFTSFSDDIGVIKFTANKSKALNFTVSLNRDRNYDVSVQGNTLSIYGQMEDNVRNNGIKYFGQIKVINKGGTLVSGNKDVQIHNADEVILLVSLATNYNGKSEETQATELLNNLDPTYSLLKKNHISKYQHFFNRVDLTLNKNKNSGLPINKRLEAFVSDKSDYDLVALYMQYGRYLLISSTRVGGLPPNLQGLWSPEIIAPWNGDYHLNINLQMNLWGAEAGNLSELHVPMIEYTKSLVEPGEKTARIYYNSRGWVTHILGNVWGFTSPSEDPSWGATNTAGAWLCQHLWEHYLYTQDLEYLKSAYPTMKGAALFFEDMLIEDPTNGYLVTAPTTSPENSYFTSDGQAVSISAGSTMDNQIIRELFTNVSEAAKLLGIDENWIQTINSKKKRLAPTTIGKYGQIMEWLQDYEEVEKNHRHVSQLYGLYPGYELNYAASPQLMEAAKTTLERRGDESTGWSMAWKINFWARLKDGNRAYKLIGDLLKPAGKGRGTYPNLFSAHPPMQIDGNFGGSAGIIEMLIQSHAGYIELLPAIPTDWKDGSIKGLKVRGGAEVSFSWKNGLVDFIEIKSDIPNSFTLELPKGKPIIDGTKNYFIENGKLSCQLNRKEKITIQFK